MDTDPRVREAIELLRSVPPRELQRLGFHFQAADFYSPLHLLDFLDANRDLWTGLDPCHGIDWNHARQLENVRRVAKHVEELRDVPDTAPDGTVFQWKNDFWNAADALVQYGIARSWKPRRWIEIGCGWSSLLLARALARNEMPSEVDLVEPYPRRELFATFPAQWRHHEVPLQRAPLALLERLEAGDVCFYDGSHCVRTASDVNWFFFQVLPRLAPGVLIHLHDIFLPEPYPEEWIFARAQTWNEQFLLQAFLMHNRDYEIEIANRYLWRNEAKLLDELYRGVQPSWGCSFWLSKRGPRGDESR